MRTVSAHNIHHKVNQHQWGGTFTTSFGKLATHVSEVGKDEMGLGHWAWKQYKGLDGHTVWVITAYNPNKSTHMKMEKSTLPTSTIL